MAATGGSVTFSTQGSAPYKTKSSLITQLVNYSTHHFDALVEKVLIELDIGKERVESIVTSESLPRIRDNTLQEISLLAVHDLRDQETTAKVSFADHTRVTDVPVYEARADLKEEISEKENLRPRGPNLVLDHFLLDVSWRLGVTGVPVFHRNLDRLQSLAGHLRL